MNALNAYNRLNANVTGMKKASEKLSSGYRINRAGDDAAGLAISEKMRSQLKGLNQAIRNSQDGINMIQTYEGAAQETHSILQRMKELATESASGTYDNATDRAAIQLEFEQLNDELNQIADTDFNGTIVLNGGVMADGTRAVDGEFNYVTSPTDASIAEAATDISGDQAHKIVDQTYYDKKIADAVWDAVGADVKNNETLNVTFTFDGEKWNATSVTDTEGKIVNGAKASGLTATRVERDDATGNGGFEVFAGDTKVTNAIFDEMKSSNGGPIKEGDTVTIQFQNTAAATYAPKNAGVDEETYTVTAGANATDHLSKTDVAGKIKFELDSSITDAAMNDTLKTALDDLDKAKFEIAYAAGVGTVTATGFTIDTDGTVTHDASNLVLGKFTIGAVTADVPAKAAQDATLDVTTANGFADTDVTFNKDNATATKDAVLTAAWGGGTITWNDADGNAVNLADYGVTIAGTPAAGWDGAVLTFTAAVDAADATSGPDANANGKVEFGVNVDAYAVVDLNNLTVHAVATPEAATMKAQLAAGTVTNANAFSNSTARLTYADNITLQTGARTKDAVNFSFQYNTDGTADMGELKANLDLSSRANGLNTANLSLANQDDANYAIDQIDKAINKTSMVRATFGAIQNRLEHKITNLTTTSENLQEAESSIRDTDMASEMMNYTKYNILQQAAQSMLAQANQQPQSILQLLG